MVIDDYGKRSYIKVLELEKRLEKIEKNSNALKVNKLSFEFSDNSLSMYKKKSFSFIANKEGRYVIDGVINTDLLSLQGVKVKIFVNGVLTNTFLNATDIELPFSFETAFVKGVNVIDVEMEATLEFSLIKLKIDLNGLLDYVETKNRVSSLRSANCDYVLHLCDDEGILMIYTFNSGLVKTLSINDLTDITILGEDGDYLTLLYTNLERNLFLKRINVNDLEVEDINLKVNNVSSVSGFKLDYAYKIYFSKLAEIYEGEYVVNEGFTYRSTGRKGVKVYADANTENCYIIVDRFNNAKFITNL